MHFSHNLQNTETKINLLWMSFFFWGFSGKGRWEGNKKSEFFSCQTLCCLWNHTPANPLRRGHTVPGWRHGLFLHRFSAARRLASGQAMSQGRDALRRSSPCSEEPKWQVMRAAVGAARVGGHHRSHQWGTAVPPWRGSSGDSGSAWVQPPFAVTLCPGCCGVEGGHLAGRRQPRRRGTAGCGGRGTKGNSFMGSREGYGLVFIFNNGQLWSFTQDYFRSRARLFHALSVPEFPLQLSESKWYYLQLLQESRSSEGASLVNGCNFCAVAAQQLLRLCYLWLPASGKDSFQN